MILLRLVNSIKITSIFCFVFSSSIFSTHESLAELIKTRKLASIFALKEQLLEKVKPKSLLTRKQENEICRLTLIPLERIEEIKRSLGDSPCAGELLSVLFFPSDFFSNTIKTNFNQFSFFERALTVIAAELGHPYARNIVILGNEENLNFNAIHTQEEFSRLLTIPFAAENGAVLKRAKELLSDEVKQESFFTYVSATQPRALVNAGYVYKFLKRLDLAAKSFGLAKNLGLRRGAMEYGFLALDKGLEKVPDFMAILTLLGLEHYAYWKLAQCYRYDSANGTIPRDLVKANEYYVKALPGGNEFPEIFYDAGDFVECLADFHEPEITGPALQRSIEHYQSAAARGLGEAFRKQVEILKKMNAPKEAIARIANQAAQQYYMHAPDLLKGAGGDQTAIEWLNLEQCVVEYYASLKRVLSCSLSF